MQQVIIPPKFSLRDYQRQAIREIYAWYRSGKKSVMLVSPTGSGKTLTSTHIIRDAISKKCRVLFIAHREPLIEQTIETLVNYGIPQDQVGFIKAGYPPATDQLVIVSSIQTLARRKYPTGIGLVVFDETHTTSFWDSSKKLIKHYAQSPLICQSAVKFLHLTATPYRTKTKEHFSNHIQCIVQAPHIGELILLGYLVPPRHFGFNGLDPSKLKTGSDGDYKKSEVAIICANQEYNELIVEKFLETCPNRRAIAFCGGVEQSKLLTSLFNKAGIQAEHIQAETPHTVRRQIYDRLRTGQTFFISSVGTLTEGFDRPEIEAVIVGRPTKSKALLIQMCGRGLRLSPHTNKQDCFLLDFGNNFQSLKVYIDKPLHISLCGQMATAKGRKQCSECGFLTNPLMAICPNCGNEYVKIIDRGNGEGGKNEDLLLPYFGELLDEETLERVKYIRSQRKMRFTKQLPPDNLWELWKKRYPDLILCNDWLRGALFGGEKTEYEKQVFLNYLHKVSPLPNPDPKWVDFHMKLEFAFNFRQAYSEPPLATKKQWWEILRVDPLSSLEQVRSAYQKLSCQIIDDDNALKLLNLAYSEYRELSTTATAEVELPTRRGWEVGAVVFNRSRTEKGKIEILDGDWVGVDWGESFGYFPREQLVLD